MYRWIIKPGSGENLNQYFYIINNNNQFFYIEKYLTLLFYIYISMNNLTRVWRKPFGNDLLIIKRNIWLFYYTFMYRWIIKPGCGENLVGQNGTVVYRSEDVIQQGGSHRVSCLWRFTIPDGKAVNLTFTEFHLIHSPRCRSSYVRVSNLCGWVVEKYHYHWLP